MNATTRYVHICSAVLRRTVKVIGSFVHLVLFFCSGLILILVCMQCR